MRPAQASASNPRRPDHNDAGAALERRERTLTSHLEQTEHALLNGQRTLTELGQMLSHTARELGRLHQELVELRQLRTRPT
jgi:hypothetical protein